ncbi:MAG: ATP-grasp domain-containing protein, partial [Pirellulales bacterium]|nr:ATP-grasp domain-containing protein [Pirellulales bacterium]
MRIFVGEYVCGGGLQPQEKEQVPEDLRTEGAAMLRAITTDLNEVADVVVPLDQQLNLSVDAGEVVEIHADQPLWAQWIEAARNCDAALIVVPESDGTLAKGVAMLRAAGIDVIAGSGDFLRVASDKLLTAKTLLAAGVAHPLYFALSDQRFENDLRPHGRFVVKPRDGCGTHKIQKFDSFEAACQELNEEQLLQAWMPGQSVSVAVVTSGTHQTFLPAVSQSLVESNCQYAGGCGPLDDESQRRATSLASRAIAAMPPTARGFVGLDLLLAERPSEDCVIEINPRLTTSYVGL